MRAETAFRAQALNPDQEVIDRMIDWRRLNQPANKSAIQTSLDPKTLHKVLGFPDPADTRQTPTHVTYRGYTILAKTVSNA